MRAALGDRRARRKRIGRQELRARASAITAASNPNGVAAVLIAVPFWLLASGVASADPDDACNGTTGQARLTCLQNVRQQLQQNQNACGNALGCSTGGIHGIIHT
jgi:hypothetical protein